MERLDYVHESTDELGRRIAELQRKRNDARTEAEHASRLGLDLGGPARAAEEDVERLESEISHLRAIVERIEQGYTYFERFGFEQAIDACGEWANWQRLSESPTPGVILGDDEADVRLPLDAQTAYKRAIDLGLFQRFDVACVFEVEGDDVVGAATYYLFGTNGLESDSNDLFLVAQW